MKGTEVVDPRSHYFVQRRRRSSFLDDWRRQRKAIARGADVAMTRSDARNANVGFLCGGDSGVPMRMIDARIIEIAPGQRTSTHRHSHDAVCFVLEGQGATTIGSQRFAWMRWDALHTPAWSWHRHENTGKTPARLLAITDAPLVRTLGLSRIEDAGDVPPEPDRPIRVPALGPRGYDAELAAAAASWEARLGARRHTSFGDLTLRTSPRGTRTALLVDQSLGYRTTGLSIALFQIPPGQKQTNHRHPGEALLYIVEGEGYSVIDGVKYPWTQGDGAIVNQYVWHQHFNGSPDKVATVIRMHMWESIIETMQAAMDPIPMYEDEPGLEERMQAFMDGKPEE
ncbi:MAG: cupin domain-containing protein [Chloroflexota bacterium]|nr:cupin domain-containing protein [Chloroflexota bacterium]MDE3193198.1 cupin domain-containing protein [Chloroflexota bacterium]